MPPPRRLICGAGREDAEGGRLITRSSREHAGGADPAPSRGVNRCMLTSAALWAATSASHSPSIATVWKREASGFITMIEERSAAVPFAPAPTSASRPAKVSGRERQNGPTPRPRRNPAVAAGEIVRHNASYANPVAGISPPISAPAPSPLARRSFLPPTANRARFIAGIISSAS